MSWEEARKQEMDWFHNNWWADVANDPDTCRQVGTENLTNYLNSELLNRLVARLPAIQEDLRKKLRILRGDLDNLPPPIEDPIKQTNQLIWKFGDAIKAAISHDNFKIPVLVGECRRELEKYTNVLVYHLFPRFCPVQSQSASTFRFDDMDDFPTALPKPPKVSAESAKPRVVYLDEIIQKCEVYVAYCALFVTLLIIDQGPYFGDARQFPVRRSQGVHGNCCQCMANRGRKGPG